VSVLRVGCGATLRVEDNGPGIPSGTVEAIRRGYETSMRHADGLGLWLVRWVVDRSVADLAFESSEGGQVVQIRFERVEEAPGVARSAADQKPSRRPERPAADGGGRDD